MIRNVIASCAIVALTACGGGGTVTAPPATAVPTATVAPTASPGALEVIQSGAPVSSLSFTSTGKSAATTITVSQTFDSSAAQETDTCSSGSAPVASIAPGTVSGTFVVTPMNVGNCNVTFTGGGGAKIVLPITVTLVQVPIS